MQQLLASAWPLCGTEDNKSGRRLGHCVTSDRTCHSADNKYAKAEHPEISSDPLVMAKCLAHKGMVIFSDVLSVTWSSFTECLTSGCVYVCACVVHLRGRERRYSLLLGEKTPTKKPVDANTCSIHTNRHSWPEKLSMINLEGIHNKFFW